MELQAPRKARRKCHEKEHDEASSTRLLAMCWPTRAKNPTDSEPRLGVEMLVAAGAIAPIRLLEVGKSSPTRAHRRLCHCHLRAPGARDMGEWPSSGPLAPRLALRRRPRARWQARWISESAWPLASFWRPVGLTEVASGPARLLV